MLTALIISFRECFEMLLVIVPLIIYIDKTGFKKLSRFVYTGSISGLILSTASAAVLFDYLRNLKGNAENIFQGSMQVFVAALIVYYMVWAGGRARKFKENIEDKFNLKTTASGLFILAFITVFRECLEIIIFIIPALNNSFMSILTGFLTGMLISILVMFLVYKTTIKLNINIIFDGLTLVLIFIGAMMFGEGLANLMPQISSEINTAGKLIFALPSLYLFIKNETGRYIRKNRE